MPSLPDVPWHVGYVRLGEHDERRHQGRCLYYEKVKGRGRCRWQHSLCHGSSHCGGYREKPKNAKKPKASPVVASDFGNTVAKLPFRTYARRMRSDRLPIEYKKRKKEIRKKFADLPDTYHYLVNAMVEDENGETQIYYINNLKDKTLGTKISLACEDELSARTQPLGQAILKTIMQRNVDFYCNGTNYRLLAFHVFARGGETSLETVYYDILDLEKGWG